jgi:hypothetical protein
MDIEKEGLIHAYTQWIHRSAVLFLFKGPLSFRSFFSNSHYLSLSRIYYGTNGELWAHVFVYSYIDIRFRFRFVGG